MRSVSIGVVAVVFFGILSLESIAQQRGQGGIPVGGLTPAQHLDFNDGSRAFARDYRPEDGLGPIFNDESCGDCHRNGGGSNRSVRRFGRIDERGDFDGLAEPLAGAGTRHRIDHHDRRHARLQRRGRSC